MYRDANSNIYLEGNQLRSEKLLKMLKIQPCQKKQEHFVELGQLVQRPSSTEDYILLRKEDQCGKFTNGSRGYWRRDRVVLSEFYT